MNTFKIKFYNNLYHQTSSSSLSCKKLIIMNINQHKNELNDANFNSFALDQWSTDLDNQLTDICLQTFFLEHPDCIRIAKSPTSCGTSCNNIVTMVMMPTDRPAAYDAPIASPSVKLWAKSAAKLRYPATFISSSPNSHTTTSALIQLLNRQYL